MKFIVREGKRRGRGGYLTWSPYPGGYVPMHHYTRRQGSARRFDTIEEAKAAAAQCYHVASFRIVTLVKKP